MSGAGDPFAPPDDGRMAAEEVRGPDPARVLATYEGSGRGRESWTLAITADRLHFTLEESDTGFQLDRAAFVDKVSVGILSSERAGLVIRRSQRVIINVPRAALDEIRTWLGKDGCADFLRKTVRAGWGMTLAAGVLFCLPMGPQDTMAYLSQTAGGLLIVAALLSRFTAMRVSFIVRALGWSMLGAAFVYGIAEGGRSRWLLVLVGLLLFSVVRFVRWYRFFGGAKGKAVPAAPSDFDSLDDVSA